MSSRIETLASTLEARFGDSLRRIPSSTGEAVYEIVEPGRLRELCVELRDAPDCAFEQLVDLTAVDYLAYGRDEWRTDDATHTGFSRGVLRGTPADAPDEEPGNRFVVAYHLLSVTCNRRMRLRVWCTGGEPPMVDSVVGVWPAANWYEREAFDLFGILFRGHPDLRRILTDYGFIGHPFRKDFPLIGNVEVRYDPSRSRVIYQPVTIEPRTLVPRVIRADNRYEAALKEPPRNG